MNLTQAAFAEKLGIPSTTADIERGRTRIPGQAVKELFKLYRINPLWLYGESDQKYLKLPSADSSPKVITLDTTGKENIVLVNAKAAAGYPHNISDSHWYDSLPAFSIPLPEFRNATFRGFQVEGNSMTPILQAGEWILGKAVNNFDTLKNGAVYVVILTDSILVKKVFPDAKTSSLQLISVNPDYPPIGVAMDAVQELWQVNSKLTFDLATDDQSASLQSLSQEIKLLKTEIMKLIKEEEGKAI